MLWGCRGEWLRVGWGSVSRGEVAVGYYSDLHVRLTDEGLNPGTPPFLRRAKVLEGVDCAAGREVESCDRCVDIGSEGCVWGRRGDMAHGVIPLTASPAASEQPAGTQFVVVDRVWGDRFDCADEADRDTALAAVYRRARLGEYEPDFVSSTVT